MTLPFKLLRKHHVPTCPLNLTVVKRFAGSYNKFVHWYRQFWAPSTSLPPYSHVCQIGDPILRHEAQPVEASQIRTVRIQKVVSKLRQVLRKYDAVGLSAPQIGVALKMFVVEFTESQKREFSAETHKLREMTTVPFKVFINPEMKVLDYEKVIFPEACESVRGFHADVPRYRKVLISGLDETGNAVSWSASGWAARIAQHEMDHLKGKMYTDVMIRSTLTCSCWHSVNATGGKLQIPFTPRKGATRYLFRAAK